ncbi:MAG: hypothetical protein D4R57_01535 [Verrucomicrobiales bacterium]|nr:MAG: hypothetical protein D4R57_01535 [Verrucomicrobiales bacterium]
MTRTPTSSGITAFIIACIMFLALAKCHALTTAEREVVTQMRDTITELRASLTDAQKSNDSALASLTLATIQTADLTAASLMAQNQAAAMTAERDTLKDEAVIKDAKIARLNHQYQFAQFIIAAVSALAAALLVFQFTRAVPAPYNFVIPLGAAGAVYGLVTILI